MVGVGQCLRWRGRTSTLTGGETRVKSFIFGIVGAALAGLALGYFSGVPESDRETPAVGSRPDKPVPMREIDPVWRPGLAQALENADGVDEFIALLNEVAESALDRDERDIWMKAVIAQWVEVSGVDAVHALKNADMGFTSEARAWVGGKLEYVFLRLALTDLDAALEIGKHYRLESLAPVILERRPELLPALLRTKRFNGTLDDWRRAGEVMARGGWENAEALKTWITNDHGQHSKSTVSIFTGFAREVAKSDPDRLMAWAVEFEKLEAEQGRQNPYLNNIDSIIRTAAVRTVAETDLERAKTLAAETGDRTVQRTVAGLMAGEDLYAAADWYTARNNAGLDSYALSELAPAMKELAVDDVLRFLEKYSAPRPDGEPVYQADPYINELGAQSAGVLAAELATRPSSPARDAVLGSALKVWAEAEPQAALEHGLRLKRAGNNPEMVFGLARILPNYPDTFLEIAAALPEATQQRFVEFTMDYGLQNGFGPLASAVAAGVEIGNPTAKIAVRSLVSEWAKDGLMATSRWLDALPDGAPKDAGIVAFVERLAPHDAAAALEWAAAAGSEAARAEALKAAETRHLD